MKPIVAVGVTLWLALLCATAVAQTLEELEARLKREQAAEAAQQAEARRKADAARKAEAAREAEARRVAEEAARAEAALGTMIVKADRDCALTVNGEAKGQLVAEQATTIKVAPGQQLIECVAGERQRVEVTERIPAGEQVVVRLNVPAPERFQQVADGVRDYEQGVVWAAQDNGSDVNWSSAGQYCRSLGGGWSLPTVAQLEGLYDASGRFARAVTLQYGTYDVKLATPLIQPTGWGYWSAESNGSSEAWAVVLNNGFRDSDDVSFTSLRRALCVRRP